MKCLTNLRCFCCHNRGYPRTDRSSVYTKPRTPSWLHSGYTATGKKKGQPVRVGLSSLGTRIDAKFSEMVPGAGLEPARLAAGDFESPESTNFTTRAVFVKTQIMAYF